LIGVEVVDLRTTGVTNADLDAAALSLGLHYKLDAAPGAASKETYNLSPGTAEFTSTGAVNIFDFEVSDFDGRAFVQFKQDAALSSASRLDNALFINGAQLQGGVRFVLNDNEWLRDPRAA